MHRFFIEPANWTGRDIRLSTSEEHHLLDVVRVSPGDEVAVFDGEGRRAVARVVEAGGGEARVVLEIARQLDAVLAGTARILIVALPKGARMDLIIEKATEMGVSEIWPVITERVVARPEGSRAAARTDRWRRIARSASKQCGRERVPDIRAPAPLSDVLPEAGECDLFLVGSLAPDAAALHDVLAERRGQCPHRVAMLIGPEGDLSHDELRAATDAGAVPVSFGGITLRVETAALFAAAVLAYEFQEAEAETKHG